MPFTQYKTLGAVLLKYDLVLHEEDFLSKSPRQVFELAHIESEIKLSLDELAYDVSEAAICETLIFPLLRENWKRFRSSFLLWSHPTISVNEDLTGIPDYLFARKTKFGRAVVGSPICIAVEAKKDNFDEGWGQCAAEMVAAQQLNAAQNEIVDVYGMVTNGEFWEFGKLKEQTFTKNKTIYSIFDLQTLYGNVNYVLEECEKQILNLKI